MDRDFYLELARKGLRMPVGTDLVLREKADHEAILHDGRRLGEVVEEAARRFGTPLGVQLMDLTLEKEWMLQRLGVEAGQIATFHFDQCPDTQVLERLMEKAELSSRLRANCESIAYIAKHTDLVPVGMSIGPFSLMTKLVADPITPVYLAGTGMTGGDDEEVRMIERVLEMAQAVVMQSIEAQVHAGAKAMFVAEPAANKVYFSPKQLAEGADTFERYAMAGNRQIKRLLDEHGVDLVFHCCGELTDEMVKDFGSLDPAILSLGSSRKLWEDARLISKRTVLFGNLPTKRFSTDELSKADVERMACELMEKMKKTGHPFILGSECDVLSVPGAEGKIREKVDAFMQCKCG
ncbi:MAG TPA: uroporphyrinogen decarboxylase family protein [Tepidisphaeraceae bacterium]|nr:uroporphyrinogen decarboxylase family protein [Tepidisphaeraceae bacterium]